MSSHCTKRNDRTVGYTLIQPSRDGIDQSRTTAIVYFYPLSGCSSAITHLEPSLRNLQCHFLCVDRPSCGQTSPSSSSNNNPSSIDRIETHIADVMAVLHHHNIQKVYCLGVCLGHPYAVELARQGIQDDSTKIAGLALVAPFVSTESPSSWWVARWGHSYVPSLVLHAGTKAIQAVSPTLMRCFLRPSAIQSLLSEEEAREWTESDYTAVYDMLQEASDDTRNCKAVEAQFGTDPSWQDVCDRFSQEMGVLSNTSTPAIPIHIYASAEDTLASLESIQWVADRCYGGSDVIHIEDTIHSHEVMTFFGGPPRNPVFLLKIAQEWGLLLGGGE